MIRLLTRFLEVPYQGGSSKTLSYFAQKIQILRFIYQKLDDWVGTNLLVSSESSVMSQLPKQDIRVDPLTTSNFILILVSSIG